MKSRAETVKSMPLPTEVEVTRDGGFRCRLCALASDAYGRPTKPLLLVQADRRAAVARKGEPGGESALGRERPASTPRRT